MINTFGLITMFASVLPVGTAIVFTFLVIETRSDLYRLEATLKRPLPKKAYNIGNWAIILEIFCILGVFSSIIICGIATDQIDYFFPWLKEYREVEGTSLTTVIGLEHVILFFKLLVRFFYDVDPNWVNIFMARRAFQKEQALTESSMGCEPIEPEGGQFERKQGLRRAIPSQ